MGDFGNSNYSDLVTRVLQNPPLAGAVKELVGDNTINLIATDWITRLKNDVRYQEYNGYAKNLWKKIQTTSILYNYEKVSQKSELNVLLLGHCKFLKPYDPKMNSAHSILVSYSEPLTEIARAMTSDIASECPMSDTFKFSFENCSIMSCHVCRDAYDRFKKSKYNISADSQPCILSTQVFDGEKVVNRFHSQMKDAFQQPFLAILHLKINARYDYMDSNQQKMHRITGIVTDIVGFQESKLYVVKKLNLGNLTLLETIPEEKICTKEDTLSDNDHVASRDLFFGNKDEPPAKKVKIEKNQDEAPVKEPETDYLASRELFFGSDDNDLKDTEVEEGFLDLLADTQN